MAKKDELSDRLYKRFKDVPGVEHEDTDGWIELAMNEHGYEGDNEVPLKHVSLVMLYAEADGASQIALRSAYFFQYSDTEESVDKTSVAEQYRKLADSLWDRYRIKRNKGSGDFGGSSFHIMKRADR